MDPVTTYLETFETLRRRKRWSTNMLVMRFAALTLATLRLEQPFDELEGVAAELRRRAGWFGPLNSEVRYVVAAMILRRELDPGRVHARVTKTREALRRYKLPRNRTHAMFAALLLTLQDDAAATTAPTFRRMEEIYERWRRDHRWLTGADDLPAAAIHAVRDESVESIALNVERAYQRLREVGFRRGNPLQLVSQLLSVDPRGVDDAVRRFSRLVEVFDQRGEKIRTSRYDETAVLTLTSSRPAALVGRVLDYRDRLRAARPRPDKEIAFALATGIAIGEDAARAEAGGAGDLSLLRSLQAILDAQQAATMAAVAAATTAASAGAAG
ncbi:MAG: DUF4003 family protein [bacterium]|nr:DUF4003 family protein [bacterium]